MRGGERVDFDKKILIESAKVIEVIQAEVYLGIGTDNDPIRKVVQYWYPCTGEYLAERLANKIQKQWGLFIESMQQVEFYGRKE